MEPLDSDEQRSVILELSHQSKQQHQLTRRLISLLFGVCVIFMLYCSAQLWRAPSTLPHQFALKDLGIPVWMFQLSYASIIYSLVLAWRIDQGQRVLIAPGIIVGGMTLFTWGAIFYLNGVTNPWLFWLPASPTVALCLGLYVQHSAKGLERDIEALEKLQYSFKKL
ncbi:unnamed protein product [Choristocarpus tenellus]